VITGSNIPVSWKIKNFFSSSEIGSVSRIFFRRDIYSDFQNLNRKKSKYLPPSVSSVTVSSSSLTCSAAVNIDLNACRLTHTISVFMWHALQLIKSIFFMIFPQKHKMNTCLFSENTPGILVIFGVWSLHCFFFVFFFFVNFKFGCLRCNIPPTYTKFKSDISKREPSICAWYKLYILLNFTTSILKYFSYN
jgi:hypothetical protein